MAAPLVPASIIPLNQRPIKNTIYLFDVDGTLSPAREVSESVFMRKGACFFQNQFPFKRLHTDSKKNTDYYLPLYILH
jgi:hypothetical protein